MAPTAVPRVPTSSLLHKATRSLTSTLSKLSIRDTTTQPLASVFALVLSSSSSISRRALVPLSDLPQTSSTIFAHHSADLLARSHPDAGHLLKRQNAILCIPATYAGINNSPTPGTVVGATLGAVFAFVLVVYIFLLSVQLVSGRGTTIIKEEVVVKKSRSRSARRSSRHTSHHSEAPAPAPPRSRRETIVEVEEEIIRHTSRRSPSRSPSLEEVIVEEEESVSEDIVEVMEEQSSIVSPSPPPRKQSSSRRSGFRTVDPAEFGGGDAPMRRVSRRSDR